MTTDLRDLLELASDDVPEADLAQAAWDTARAQRRAVRRRTLLGAGAAAAAGALVAVVVRERPSDPGVPGDEASAAPGRLATAEVGGSSSTSLLSPAARPCSPPTRTPRPSRWASGSGSTTPASCPSSDPGRG